MQKPKVENKMEPLPNYGGFTDDERESLMDATVRQLQRATDPDQIERLRNQLARLNRITETKAVESAAAVARSREREEYLDNCHLIAVNIISRETKRPYMPNALFGKDPILNPIFQDLIERKYSVKQIADQADEILTASYQGRPFRQLIKMPNYRPEPVPTEPPPKIIAKITAYGRFVED